MGSRALVLREGAAPVGERLMTTCFLAALLHGIVLLGVTFGTVGSDGGAPGLDVLIVSEELPEADRNDSASYLAQRTQLGSGTTAKPEAAASPAAARDRRGQAGDRSGASEAAERRGNEEQAEQLLAATDLRTEVRYVADPADPARPADQPLLIEEQRGREASGPSQEENLRLRGAARDELWVAPDTRESVLAPYLDAWRRKIERLGTLNFPAAARASASGASPVLEVAIDSSGRLESAGIRRSSGSPELDQAALGILKLASPFDPFPRELAAHYRVLRFAYEWQFVGGQVERGRLSAPADSH